MVAGLRATCVPTPWGGSNVRWGFSRPACAAGAVDQLLCGPTDDAISRLQIETALSHAGFHTTTDVSGDVWRQIVGTTHCYGAKIPPITRRFARDRWKKYLRGA